MIKTLVVLFLLSCVSFADDLLTLQSLIDENDYLDLNGEYYNIRGSLVVSKETTIKNAEIRQGKSNIPTFEIADSTDDHVEGTVRIENINLHGDGGQLVGLSSGQTVDDLWVVNNRTTRQGIAIYGTVNNRCRVEGNTIGNGSGGYGIGIGGLTANDSIKRAEVVSNFVRGNPQAGSVGLISTGGNMIDEALFAFNDVAGSAADCFDFDGVRRLRIIGNIASQCNQGFEVKSGRRPDGEVGEDVMFIGNTTYDCPSVALSWRVEGVVAQNHFYGPSARAIYASGGAEGSRIVGNVFHRTEGGPTGYAIQVNAGYISISSNVVRESYGGIRIDSGDGIRISDNNISLYPANGRSAVRFYKKDNLHCFIKDNNFHGVMGYSHYGVVLNSNIATIADNLYIDILPSQHVLD